MSKPARRTFQPLEKLKITGTSAQAVQLASARARMEISVLAPDLFRLRVTKEKEFSPKPSWAVVKTKWDTVATRLELPEGEARLGTEAGRFTLQLATGAWKLEDAHGITLFECAASECGFEKDEARVTLKLAEDESLFGLGETSNTFNKRGLVREFWNSDVLGHASCIHPCLRNLYVSIPFGISLRLGRAAGLFQDIPARQQWNLGQGQLERWQMSAHSGEVDIYFFLGPKISEVVERFTELTGRMPLPPQWGLGYQQSRYSYPTRERVEEIARTFRAKQIPCDALYLDIHHMEGYRVFTFGKDFPKPGEMMRKLRRKGFKVVTIVDPGVKNEARFGVLKRGRAIDAFVKKPKGKKEFVGKVWPGRSCFPDFTNAKVRAWWGREQARFQKLGVAGFWNDMNEPAIFDGPGKTLGEDCPHQSDYGPLLHREAHNVYGMQMARASREGALRHRPEERPFIITRAGYAGVQREAIVWTGDNSSTWEHLAESVPMLLNLSLSGVAFCGADVGGFLDSATGELLARWTQLAAFTPFFRNHSNIESRDQEPWAFGAEVEGICRRYIQLRYQLLPYLYGLFAGAHRQGTPIMRPLSWHFQNDPVAAGVEDQFLLGPDLLVAPILRRGAKARSVYLPRGQWFNFWTGEMHDGLQHVVAHAELDTLPLFVRGGAIIPMGPVQQQVNAIVSDVVNLHLWPEGHGELHWYEDDGRSQRYLRGEWHERMIRWSDNNGTGVLRFENARGNYASRVKTWRLILRERHEPLKLRVNGKKAACRFVPEAVMVVASLTNTSNEMTIRWE